MFNICTSDTCKNLIIIFALFLALYLILTNSKQKVNEYFAEEQAEKTQTTDKDQVKKADKEVKNESEDKISSDIKRIYKTVYGKDITNQQLEDYIKKGAFTKYNFDPEIFRKGVESERIAELENMVNNSFIKLLNRAPSPDETDMYITALLKGSIKNVDELNNLLANSPEKATTSDITRQAAVKDALKVEDYKVYKNIIDVFQKVLERLPNSAELNFYFTTLKTDKTFNLDKLENALIASREHMILEMNQQNTIHGDLKGNITERQIELIVNSIYKSIYQYEPDKFTFNFVRAKFIDMNLNEEKLVKYVQQLKALDSSPLIETDTPLGKLLNQAPSFTTSSVKLSNQDKFIETKPDASHFTMIKPETDKLETKSVNVYTKDPKEITTENIVNLIKDSAKNTVLDKHSIDYVVKTSEKQVYADTVNTRNEEVTSNNNARTSKYLTMDKKMI